MHLFRVDWYVDDIIMDDRRTGRHLCRKGGRTRRANGKCVRSKRFDVSDLHRDCREGRNRRHGVLRADAQHDRITDRIGKFAGAAWWNGNQDAIRGTECQCSAALLQ